MRIHNFQQRVYASWFGSQIAGTGMSAANLPNSIHEMSEPLNKILRAMATAAREEFQGKLTYSAGSWENVDWSIFDIVGVDHYRRGETAEVYTQGLDRYRLGKPLAVMEVGCCTYEGAAARGDGGFAILQGTNEDGTGRFVDNLVPKRSEAEQADYIETQLGLLLDAGVESVFVFIFSFPVLKTGEGARDLDLASFSLVKTLPEDDLSAKAMPTWKPKESFYRLSRIYGGM